MKEREKEMFDIKITDKYTVTCLGFEVTDPCLKTALTVLKNRIKTVYDKHESMINKIYNEFMYDESQTVIVNTLRTQIVEYFVEDRDKAIKLIEALIQ